MSISKKRKRQRMEEFIGTAYSIAIYAILYIPVLVMMMFSFNNQRYNYYWNGFTTQWYTKLFSNSALIESLWYSVVIAVLATIISVTIGTIGALGLKKYEFRGKKFINEMLYIPIIVPIVSISFFLVYCVFKVFK
jgi:spermidine/putrescine transport system permease protein